MRSFELLLARQLDGLCRVPARLVGAACRRAHACQIAEHVDDLVGVLALSKEREGFFQRDEGVRVAPHLLQGRSQAAQRVREVDLRLRGALVGDDAPTGPNHFLVVPQDPLQAREVEPQDVKAILGYGLGFFGVGDGPAPRENAPARTSTCRCGRSRCSRAR